MAFVPALALASSAPSLATPLKRPVTMGPWRAGEKDEAFRKQQEILAARRDEKAKKAYFDDVEARRRGIEDRFEERKLKVTEGEDPLIEWQRMKDAGLIDDAGYPEEEEGGEAAGGIPMPMASFGIPKYDNGGRFDLKLPHVEFGYEDDDADVMGKIGRFFGMGKKKGGEKGGEK